MQFCQIIQDIQDFGEMNEWFCKHSVDQIAGWEW